MLKRLFTFTDRLRAEVADEVGSLCHAQQIEDLARTRHLMSDVGLDCGCDRPASRVNIERTN